MMNKFTIGLLLILLTGCNKMEVKNSYYTMEIIKVEEKNIVEGSDLHRFALSLEYDATSLIKEFCDGGKKRLNLTSQASKKELQDELQQADKMALEDFDYIEGKFERRLSEFQRVIPTMDIQEGESINYKYRYVITKNGEIFRQTKMYEFIVDKK